MRTQIVDEKASVHHHAGLANQVSPYRDPGRQREGALESRGRRWSNTGDAVNRGNNAGETEVLDLNQPV